jgi:hypothetical protein
VGSVLLTAPVSLPAVLVTAGGYLTLAGGVLSAVSQVTVDDDKLKGNKPPDAESHAE